MPALEALFIEGPTGRLFIIHHLPTAPIRRCVIVVPPFAEEMNKARRQVALCARALRDAGTATIICDLGGTGDSDGALVDRHVDHWIDDLEAAASFARDRGYDELSLLCVRSGALLCVPLLARGTIHPRQVIWWQPVTTGKMLVNQFLRLKSAAGMMSAAGGESVKALRERLAAGETLEVAGYALSSKLAQSLDALSLTELHTQAPVSWYQIGTAGAPATPAVNKTLEVLHERDVDVSFESVDGEPFWATAEIATAPAAIRATVARLAGDP